MARPICGADHGRGSASVSHAYATAEAACEAARVEYEAAFVRFVKEGRPADLANAVAHYRRWRDLIDVRMMVPYYEQYGVMSHMPGAP